MSDAPKPALASLAAEREQIIAVLSDGFSRDMLDMDEFEARMDRAHRASSREELQALVADLEPKPATALVPQAATALAVDRPDKRRLIAILGGIERKGQWVAPRKLSVVAVLGGVSLDLREAVFGPGVTEIKVRTVLGGVEIIVPPHVAVEADGMAILGGFEDMQRAPLAPDPDRPLVRISGAAVLGGVAISTLVPGQDRGERHHRRRELPREQRKRLRARQDQLGPGGDDDDR